MLPFDTGVEFSADWSAHFAGVHRQRRRTEYVEWHSGGVDVDT
jgi:hypothetical protein